MQDIATLIRQRKSKYNFDDCDESQSQSESQGFEYLLASFGEDGEANPKPAFCFEEPSLVSEVCFCIFLSCVLVLVL